MDVKSALDAMDVSAEAFLLLPPDLKRNAAVQSFAFDKRASLALEVDLTGKDLESAMVRAIRKGLTLEEVAKKHALFTSNLPCILAALTRDPSEMRFANLRVASSTLDAQQKLQLRNKVQECVLKDGKTLLFAEQFRGDTLIVLSACIQDARLAALATDPLGTQLCRIEIDCPGNLAKVANILVKNQTRKRKLFPPETWSAKLSLPPCLVKQAQQESLHQATQHTNHESSRPNNKQDVDKRQPTDIQDAKPSTNQEAKPGANQNVVQEAEPSTNQDAKPSANQNEAQEAAPGANQNGVQEAEPFSPPPKSRNVAPHALTEAEQKALRWSTKYTYLVPPATQRFANRFDPATPSARVHNTPVKPPAEPSANQNEAQEAEPSAKSSDNQGAKPSVNQDAKPSDNQEGKTSNVKGV